MGEPWLQDPDVTLYHGDALETLRQLPDRTVHMVATSPPFYGLRDYGTGDQQIGLEETPDQWIDRLVAVFRECRRVLRDDGTLWVEIGDSYNGSGGYAPDAPINKARAAGEGWGALNPSSVEARANKRGVRLNTHKPKDLLGQPWLLAFALRADGWYLRSEIIWARPNPMPESVTDRPTKAHSTVFLLSKSRSYFYDADAIREAFKYDGRKATHVEGGEGSVQHRNGERWPGLKNPTWEERKAAGATRGNLALGDNIGAGTQRAVHGEGLSHDLGDPSVGANARSVWQIPTEPTPFAHFATWPQALVRRMIQAGTSERGCCPECGAPWVRETETVYGADKANDWAIRAANGARTGGVGKNFRDVSRSHVGWSPSCQCSYQDDLVIPHPIPCTVLDPFAGSGTTCLVARNHGRHAIGIELNEAYLKIAGERLQQLSLLADQHT